MVRRRAAAAVLAAAVAAVAPACGSSTRSAKAPVSTTTAAPITTTSTAPPCGEEVHEQLDSRSTQHVLPGSPEPKYLTDPPTSGPHRIGAASTGVAPAPIDRPLQVHMLEDGTVLLQYRDLPADQRAALEQLAGGQIVVAPNPSLPAPVVATAWTFKLTCTAVDAAALRAFAQRHAGKGSGQP